MESLEQIKEQIAGNYSGVGTVIKLEELRTKQQFLAAIDLIHSQLLDQGYDDSMPLTDFQELMASVTPIVNTIDF